MSSQLQTDLLNIQCGVDELNNLASAILNHQELLPYVPLEYIQTDGTQYVELNKVTTANFGFEIDVNILSGTGANLFGAGNGSGQYPYFNLRDNMCKYSYSDGNTSHMVSYGSTDYNQHHIYKFIKENNYNYYYHEDLKGSLNISHPVGANIVLFTFRNDDGTIRTATTETCKCKFYGMKIYEGTTVVNNYIPVKRNSDNVICIYDTITSTFLLNAGTGTFTAGPEKIIKPKPLSHTLLEYIESSGSQYINTKIPARNVGRIETKFKTKTVGEWYWFCGASDDTTLSTTNAIGICEDYISPAGRTGGIWYNTRFNTYEFIADTLYTIDYNMQQRSQSIDINGTVYSGTKTGTITGASVFLLSQNYYYNTGSWSQGTNCTPTQLYYFKLYGTDQTTLLRDFIPVKTSTNYVCLYDRVSGEYFYNENNTDFIAGPEKL